VPTGTSISEVALHNSESDCWVGYKGKVYDITSFMPNHKNYQALLVPLCGSTDKFETAFEGKHGTSKVEVLVSQSTLIGDLAQ
jgi:cytochrome b involved in lipid metabolism